MWRYWWNCSEIFAFIHAKYNFAILDKGEVMFLYQTEMGEEVNIKIISCKGPSKALGKYQIEENLWKEWSTFYGL